MRRFIRQAGLLDIDTLTLAFDASGECVQMLSPDGRVLALNAGGAAAMGFDDPEELIGRRWIDIWSGEDHAAAQRAVTSAQDGHRKTVRGFMPTKTGAPKCWRSTLVPLGSAGQPPERLLVISTDVTEQVDAERALERSTQLQQALIEATSEIVWHVDKATGVTTRRGHQDFTGRADDPANLDGWLEDVHPEDRDRAKAAADEADDAGVILAIEYRLFHKTGEWRWVRDCAAPVRNSEGKLTDWVGIITDIHDRECAERALRKSVEHVRLAVEATGLGTWDVDMKTGARDWSPETFDLMGLPRDAEPSERLFLGQIHPEDRDRADRELTGFGLRDGRAYTSIFRVSGRDGQIRWVEARERNFHDEDGTAIRRVGTIQDITERKRAEHEIWLAAHTDALTKIANRALFQARLDEAVDEAQRQGSDVGLLLFDLDRFKEVNDALGHDAGDAMLRTVADRLKREMPESATVARLGGDEFGVILAGKSFGSSLQVWAEDLLSQLKKPLNHSGLDIECSASVGWAIYPDHAQQPATLLKNADLALYAAKGAGRGRSAGFKPAMGIELERRLTVLRSAREALAQNAVIPFYQPKVCLTTGRVIGFEALLRWIDETGLRSPGAIQEALDDAELSKRLGSRMIERVASDMRSWNAAGVPFGHVALNAAAGEFAGGALGKQVLDHIRTSGLKPEQIEIEVTERVLLDDGKGSIEATLKLLHQAGVAIALDDFGTGYASLTHLTRFPVSWVKIDRSFTSNLGIDPSAALIVEAVVELAHSLKIKVIAEGIETIEQITFLKTMGCDLGQGFLLAKPMGASRVPHFLEAWNRRARGEDANPAPPRLKSRPAA